MAVFDNIKGIGVASGFKLQAQSALDPRLVVATIAERDELVTSNGAYEGMSVYVKANKKTYQLQGTTISDWVDITSEASSMSALESEIKTARGDNNTLGDRLDTMDLTSSLKQSKFNVDNGLHMEPAAGQDLAKLSIVLDPSEDNALTNSSDGLKVVVPEGKDYTVTVDTTTTTDGMAKSYTFKQLGQNIVTVDIPKDMVVSNGEVKNLETKPDDFPESQTFTAGMYIILTIANSTASKLYIPASGLVDVYTGDEGTTTKVKVTIDNDNKISAEILENAISKTQLSTDLQTEINNKVNKTDYATSEKAGIAQFSVAHFVVGNDGIVNTLTAQEIHIKNRMSTGIIDPSNLNDAVKATFTDSNKISMTDEEKATARSVIGAVDVNTINSAINEVKTEIETASYEKTANKVAMTIDGTFAEGTYPTVASLQTIFQNINGTLNGVELKANRVDTAINTETNYTAEKYPSALAVQGMLALLQGSIADVQSTADAANQLALTSEQQANKVTEKLTSTGTYTENQYPTANAVKGALGDLVNSIEANADEIGNVKSAVENKVSVTWVNKGESVPTIATANSLCFRIL